jgi:hypothetical protein
LKVQEIAMHLASLQTMIRSLSTVFIVSAFASAASIAHASMTCTWIDEFPAVSDPSIQERLEAHVRALPGLKDYQIRQIDSRFFIVSDEGKCKQASRCYHRLLDFRNGVVKNVLVFRGTGRVWMMLSPTAVWLEPLQDDYSNMAFATPENVYITVQLPIWGDTILIDASPPEETKMLQRLCGAPSK